MAQYPTPRSPVGPPSASTADLSASISRLPPPAPRPTTLQTLSNTMSNYFSSLTSKLPPRALAIFSSGEEDGDTPNDTHIARVLRNYYSETGRGPPYPEWLGNGPGGSSGHQREPSRDSGGYGASLRRGGQQQPQQQPGNMGPLKATLSDIWDRPSPAQGANDAGAVGGQTGRPRFFNRGSDDSSASAASGNSRVKERLWARTGQAQQAASVGPTLGAERRASPAGGGMLGANMPWQTDEPLPGQSLRGSGGRDGGRDGGYGGQAPRPKVGLPSGPKLRRG